MNETVAVAAILSAVAGAVFAVWWNTPDKVVVSHIQLAKAMSLSAFGAIGLVNITSLPNISDPLFSFVGLIVTYLLIGSGLGKASNHLQLNTPTS